VPDDQFDSIDAIEKHFGKLRRDAGDDDEKKRELSIDEREAKADFRERVAQARELSAHREAALAKAGIPEDFHDFVTGRTPEEIDAAVTKVKERIDKLTAAAGQQGAQNLYGNPLNNGGGNPPPPRTPEQEKWISDFQQRFSDPSASVTVGEINRYTEILGGSHLLKELAETSRIFKRNGITPELVEEHLAGTLKQTKPARSGVTLPPRA